MRYQVVALMGLVLASTQAPMAARAGGQALPTRDGRPVVAVVGEQPIFLDEFLLSRGPSADRTALQQGRGTADDVDLLNRLVTIRLIAQEATRMGLGEVPEIQRQVEVTSREILREVLLQRIVRDIIPDRQKIEQVYRESVREWKTSSLLFKDAAPARRARQELISGAPFADVSARAVAAKLAETSDDADYHPKEDYLPEIAAALALLEAGGVTPVISLEAGFVVAKVVDIRYPDNPEARADAEKRVLNEQHLEFLKVHEKAQRRQYVVIHEAVLEGLDYAADRPTLEELLTDTRVVAEIKGADRVTVADLTDYLRMQFFHDSDRASQRRRMNEQKAAALDATLGRRLLNMEALRVGIDQTPAYRDRVTGFRESLVFDAFMQKVIAPDNKMTEDEVRRYYDQHARDYAYPGMLRMRGLAFAERRGAEDAMRKLREGADYSWLAANAAGRLPSDKPGLLSFDGRPVTVDSMPAGLQKNLVGAGTGDARLWASPEGPVYVLVVQEVIGAATRPYAEVRDEIAQKLYGEKLQKDLEEYARRLRAQSKVETYLVRTR